MLVLDGRDVVQALSIADCIDAVAEGLRLHAQGEQTLVPRQQLRAGPDDALMGLMPAAGGAPERLWGLKAVLVAPGNRMEGLDSHQGAILLFDARTGVPRALVDATSITALRTAAASAVATLALARPDARTIAILGSGTQARSHIAAMRHILPRARIVLWGRSPAAARKLALELDVETASDARLAVEAADVVCTLTGSAIPVIERDWLRPGAHVNAVGASRPDTRELGSDVIAAAEVFVDLRAQAETECGELLIARSEGRIGDDHIRAELGEVLAGLHAGRTSERSLTVFKSLGIAIEDLSAAVRAVRRAADGRIGREFDWRAAEGA